MEDDAEVSHLGKPESEIVAGGLPEKIPEDPLFKKESPKGLCAAAVFQQKLLGSGHGHFMTLTTDSLVVIHIPIPRDTTIRNEVPVGTESLDMESSIPNPPLASGPIFRFFLCRLPHPFAMRSFPKRPFEIGVVYDEEALHKARSWLMEGILGMVEATLDPSQANEQNVKGLREEADSFSERNQSLVRDLSQAIGQQEELKKLNQDLQLKLDDVVSHHASSIKELEGVSQQYHLPKSQYTEKVSQLEIACSSKDVSIKLLEEELAMMKLLMLEKGARISTLSDSQFMMEQNTKSFQTREDQKADELRWFIKEGIPIFVRYLLDSSDFGVVNVTLQTSAIQLSLHQGCVEMKEK
ncbi:unnamed protein product [Lactuca saligna]|uniref:Uncharacterized protein n=1 Tax=Lactuca saligna TaxID=75948 RepID=A0AA36E7G0_LACSI|nr:unnamed protein product [Lactuca saligna]